MTPRLYTAADNDGDLNGVRTFLSKNDDPNAIDPVSGRRPIHAAAYMNHIDILDALKGGGADLFAKDREDQSLLHSAARGYNGNHDVFVWTLHSMFNLPVREIEILLVNPKMLVTALIGEDPAAVRQLRQELTHRNTHGDNPIDILYAKTGHEAEYCHDVAAHIERLVHLADEQLAALPEMAESARGAAKPAPTRPPAVLVASIAA